MTTTTHMSSLLTLFRHRLFMLVAVLVAAIGVTEAQVSPSTSASGKLGAVLFRVESDRLFPTKVTVPPGRYLIQVDNGMISAALTLSLNASAGAYLSGKSMPVKASRGSFIVVLPADTYTLAVQGYPKWTSQIVVQTK